MVTAATAWSLPFVPTTDPASASTHWYQIKTGNLYLYSNSHNFDDVDVSSISSTSNEYLWCFVGTESTGYKIYNRAVQAYLMDGFRVYGNGDESDLDYVELGSGNSFYIYYRNRNQKFYICYSSDNGLFGSVTKYNSYTVVEYTETPMVVTPYNQLTPDAYSIPHNNLSNFGDEGYAKLFDKSRDTKWCIVNISGSWEPVTIDFHSDVAFIPDAYYLSTANDTQGFPNRNPKEWKIYGKRQLSDDWTVLAHVTDGAAAGLGTVNKTDYKFSLNGITQAFQYFRFEIISIRGRNSSDNNWVFQLSELQFTGEAVTTGTKGDVDGDGKVDVSDVNKLVNIILGKESANAAANVDGIGAVDVNDINMLINILLGKGNGSTTTYTVNGVSFKMVDVEGGTFTMGLAPNDYSVPEASDAKPSHLVMVSDFSIGQTEVTQELWQAVMGYNPSILKGDKRPVECVSWNLCQEFITKLNQLTGTTFRMPTEAEWEYAARGGNKSKGYTYSGSNNRDEVAWYYQNAYAVGKDSPDYGTHTVATKAPNELGIYDMSGNVNEWCYDFWGPYTSDSQVNPTGPETGTKHVCKGDCWMGDCYTVAYRFYQYTSTGSSTLGLRLVK